MSHELLCCANSFVESINDLLSLSFLSYRKENRSTLCECIVVQVESRAEASAEGTFLGVTYLFHTARQYILHILSYVEYPASFEVNDFNNALVGNYDVTLTFATRNESKQFADLTNQFSDGVLAGSPDFSFQLND